MAIHKFTRLIESGEKVPMYGDGSSRRDYTFIDDLIEGILTAIRHHKGFEVYNLGESQTTSLKELIRLIEEALGKKAEIEELGTQPGDVLITYADSPKARGMLGYQPRVRMEEGMKRFVDWYNQAMRSFSLPQYPLTDQKVLFLMIHKESFCPPSRCKGGKSSE